MTILCPAEFYEATVFAEEIDEALKAATARAVTRERHDELLGKIGRATKSLLSCFACKAFSDDMDTKHPYIPDDSEIRFSDGRRAMTMAECRKAWITIIRDTFIYPDFCKHSFFFREEWIDRDTRCTVGIFDKCWYVFNDGRSQEDADALTDTELEDLSGKDGISRTFSSEEAEAAAAKGIPVKQARLRRKGMCGGFIFHPDYENGQATKWGSWSTHT